MGKGNKARSNSSKEKRFKETSLPSSKHDVRVMSRTEQPKNKSVISNNQTVGGDVRPPPMKPTGIFYTRGPFIGQEIPQNRLKKDYGKSKLPFQKDNHVPKVDNDAVVNNPFVSGSLPTELARVVLRFWFSRLYQIEYGIRQYPILPFPLVRPFFQYICQHLDVPRYASTDLKIAAVVAQLTVLRSDFGRMVEFYNLIGPIAVPSGYVNVGKRRRYLHHYEGWDIYEHVTADSWPRFEVAHKAEQLNGANGTVSGTDDHNEFLTYRGEELFVTSVRVSRVNRNSAEKFDQYIPSMLLGTCGRCSCETWCESLIGESCYGPAPLALVYCLNCSISCAITRRGPGEKIKSKDVPRISVKTKPRGFYIEFLERRLLEQTNYLNRLRSQLNGSHGEDSESDDVKIFRKRKEWKNKDVELKEFRPEVHVPVASFHPPMSNRFDALRDSDESESKSQADVDMDAFLPTNQGVSVFEDSTERTRVALNKLLGKGHTRAAAKAKRDEVFQQLNERTVRSVEVEMDERVRGDDVVNPLHDEVGVDAPEVPPGFQPIVADTVNTVATTPVEVAPIGAPAKLVSKSAVKNFWKGSNTLVPKKRVAVAVTYNPVIIQQYRAEPTLGSVAEVSPVTDQTTQEGVEPKLHFPSCLPYVVGGKSNHYEGEKFSLAQGGYIVNEDGMYRSVNGVYFHVATGDEFPHRVYESEALATYARKLGDNLYQRTSPRGHRKRLLASSSSRVIKNFVVASDAFKWFANFRSFLRKSGNLLTLGQYYTENMFTGMSTVQRDIVISVPLLRRLYRKIGAVLSDLANTILLEVALKEIGSEDQSILLDTIIYFSVLRAESQKVVNGNTVAAQKWAKSKCLYRKPGFPSYLDMSVTSQRINMHEGAYANNSAEEAYKNFREGFTSVDRLEYTTSSDLHGSYDNPVLPDGGMYEPFNKKEVKRMSESGILFKSPYIKFPTMEILGKPPPYQTVAGGFATQGAVVNHLDVMEATRAHLRLFAARTDELEKREVCGQVYSRVLDNVKTLSGRSEMIEENLEELVRRIKQDDPGYNGTSTNSDLFMAKHGRSYTLSVDQERFALIRAAISVVQSEMELSYEEERAFDDVKALSDYVDKIGSKLKLRRAGLERMRSGLVDILKVNRANLVQMKPHETQKYKIKEVDGQQVPVLKFGRDVVSITDDDWLKARPHLCCYMKKVLEDLLCVTITRSGFQVEFGNVLRHYDFPVGLRLVSYHRRVFKYRALLSSTSIETLAEAINEMYDAIENDNDISYGVSFGDDQYMLTYNRDPRLYGGKEGVVVLEGDIKDNDGSHVDSFYRCCYATQCLRGEESTEMFAQLARPILIYNPASFDEYAVLRYKHGMRMCSGSAFTTVGNSDFSRDVMLMHVVVGGDDYVSNALELGVDVSLKIGDLEDCTFLSKNFYRGDDGHIAVYTDLASLARSFGKVPGDFAGSSKNCIVDRYYDHCKQVVQSWVHEPNSAFVVAMREVYVNDRSKRYPLSDRADINDPSKISKMLGRRASLAAGFIFQTEDHKRRRELSNGLFALSAVDIAVVKHYYPGDFSLGESQYRSLIRLIMGTEPFGNIIVSNFIDKIMDVRYGMAPAVLA